MPLLYTGTQRRYVTTSPLFSYTLSLHRHPNAMQTREDMSTHKQTGSHEQHNQWTQTRQVRPPGSLSLPSLLPDVRPTCRWGQELHTSTDEAHKCAALQVLSLSSSSYTHPHHFQTIACTLHCPYATQRCGQGHLPGDEDVQTTTHGHTGPL